MNDDIQIDVHFRKRRPPRNASIHKLGYIEPIGIGTGDIESLTGIMGRMANAHYMRPRSFARYIVKEFGDGKSAPKTVIDGKDQRTINGSGAAAHLHVKGLCRATGDEIFTQCTLISWRDLFCKPSPRLLRPTLAWCPVCLQRDGEVPYHRLFWTIQSVAICPDHKCVLESQCPRCKAEQPIVPRTPIWYRCNKCSYDLRCSVRRPRTRPNRYMNLWIARAIRQFVHATCAADIDVPHDAFWCQMSGLFGDDRRVVAEEISSRIDITKDEFIHITSGYTRPCAETLWKLSYFFDVPPDALLLGSYPMLSRNRQYSTAASSRPTRSVVNTGQQREELYAIITDYIEACTNHHPSASEVARHAGITYMKFKYHFPDTYKRVRERYEGHKEEQTRIRRENRKIWVESTCELLMADGIYPTERRLKEMKNIPPSYFRTPEGREILEKCQRWWGGFKRARMLKPKTLLNKCASIHWDDLDAGPTLRRR